MNEITESAPPRIEKSQSADSERTKQSRIAGWTAGLSAMFALGALSTSPGWPTAIGVAAVSAMITVVCQTILKKE